MANELPNPSKLTLYSGLFLFVGLEIISLFYFVVSITNMWFELNAFSRSINFNKGVFYFPGIILGLGVLIFLIVYESVLRKQLTKKIASISTRIGIASVVVMFVLPQLAEYGVDRFLTDQNYQICEEASHQWLHSKTIVYTRGQEECGLLVIEKQ